MLEWHALSRTGHDTWHRGRFMREWADARALAQLPGTFGAFDLMASWQALFATTRLFHWLARETAQMLGHDYKHALYGEITNYLEQLQKCCIAARSNSQLDLR